MALTAQETPAVDFTQLSDAELVAKVEQYKEAAEQYRRALDERTKRKLDAEQKQEEAERKAFLKSDKFKKLQAKFKKAMERVNGVTKKREVTVNVTPTKTYHWTTWAISPDQWRIN